MKDFIKSAAAVVGITLVVGVVAGIIIGMPYILFTLFHFWDGANDWNCRYHGGYTVATTSAFGGPMTLCQLP